jgi:hypothetical protein
MNEHFLNFVWNNLTPGQQSAMKAEYCMLMNKDKSIKEIKQILEVECHYFRSKERIRNIIKYKLPVNIIDDFD